ncbi:MAG: hypothetical protein LQ344_000846 [Seirophora lacunosa]|nr:MAG: hypothetical protein LQ344_000846 [Seirophora lacunosa]
MDRWANTIWRQHRLMDRGAPDQYSQSDPASAAQYTPRQDVQPSGFGNTATPNSDFVTPSAARPTNLDPGYLAQQRYAHQQQQQQQQHSHASAASMAQASSPSLSLHDAQQNNHHNPQHVKSNSEVPIDPSIAASSPSYPPYSPYAQQGHDMSQYQGHPPHGYHPGWPQQYAGHPHMPGGPYSSPGSGVSPGASAATAGPRSGQNPHPLSQVYSFVPIPGAQQHKRPRRRYEEIERMYKCGWQGCEKAYGTLNHLNAHVTMQSHGQKRTPEEFKEIRKEWKQRKKEEEAQRKSEDERQRGSQGGQSVDGQSSDPAQTTSGQNYAPGARPHLPPIGYAPAQNQMQPQYASGVEQMYQAQSNGQVYSAYPPHSPYGQGQQMYVSVDGDAAWGMHGR